MQTKVWIELTEQYRETVESRRPTVRPKPEEIMAALRAIQALLWAIGHMTFWGYLARIRLCSLTEMACMVFDHAERAERVEQENKAKTRNTAQAALIV